MRNPIDRFNEKYEVDSRSGCWLWTASCVEDGYGQFRFSPKKMGKAHVFAYQHYVGPVPSGMQLDHLCRVRRCVNPDHLEVVTGWENTMRGDTPAAINARKTHCPRGHPYDEQNTYLDKTCRRHCRSCW